MLRRIRLTLAAGYAARRSHTVTIPIMLAVVLTYQVAGTLGEWALTGSFAAAAQDFRIGLPGMLLQVVGGYLIIRHVITK